MSFSERYGYKPLRDTIQIESMDSALRNGLWSALKVCVWDQATWSSGIHSGYYLSNNPEIRALCQRLWFDYFKTPLDQLGNDWEIVLSELRKHFFSCEWHEAYDFVEFVANNYERHGAHERFVALCNDLLEREMSGYRFVDGVITHITDEAELNEIEEATHTRFKGTRQHLHRALELLSDREKPDYRNSIKESISAVESLVGQVLHEKGTLGELIKSLEDEIGLHPALKAAFSKLYGYTSDESGIRHALTEANKVDFHDAKFMLVVCAAFINFVNGKVARDT